MKLTKIFSILLLGLTLIIGCDDSEDVVTTTEGGLVEIQTASINYVVGNTGPYTASVRILQGDVKTTKVEIYKSFNSGDESSEEVLFTTITPETTDYSTVSSFDFTFDELREGLQINGATLPATDGEYSIGDNWEFRVVSTVDDGRQVQQNRAIKVTVATRFAGKYRAVDAVYGRNTTSSGGGIEWFYTEDDWPAETVIESVDATTYRILEYFGPSPFDGNEWYFQVDPGTLEITYPEFVPGTDTPQNGNGQPFISCSTNAGDFADMGLDCATSNKVVLDDVEGKDRLYMTYGYYTAGSGPRTFYHELEKIVE
jgi:hypothetical protein